METTYWVHAEELQPGDVFAEKFLRYRKVRAAYQRNGWVEVAFDPTGSVALDNGRRVELVRKDEL